MHSRGFWRTTPASSIRRIAGEFIYVDERGAPSIDRRKSRAFGLQRPRSISEIDSALEETGLKLLGPSPALGADRAIQNEREAMCLASRNEHWPTLPSVGNQVNTAVYGSVA